MQYRYCIFSAFAVYINIMKGMITMKKFLSVAVAVLMCACLMAPAAFATDAYEELDQLAAELGIGEIMDNISEDEVIDPQVEVEEAIQGAIAEAPEGIADVASTFDINQLTGVVGDIDFEAFSTLFEDFDVSKTPELLDMISGVFASSGVDASSFEADASGKVDVMQALNTNTSVDGQPIEATGDTAAGGQLAASATDTMSGLAEGLMSGLEGLGLDSSFLDSIQSSSVVNFFASLYCGTAGGEAETTTTTTAAPTETTTTTTTTEVPDTGDTSTVVFAGVALAMASIAAGVCLKKKEEE